MRGLVLVLSLPSHITAYPSSPAPDLSCSRFPLPLATILYLCKNICSKYVLPPSVPLQPRTPPNFFHYHFLSWKSKSSGYTVLTQFPIHLFRFPSTHNLYPFPESCPSHIPEPLPFFTISFIGTVSYHHLPLRSIIYSSHIPST